MPHSTSNFTVHSTWVSAVRTEEHEIDEASSLEMQHTLPPAVHLRQRMHYPTVLYRCTPCHREHRLTNTSSNPQTHTSSLGLRFCFAALWWTEGAAWWDDAAQLCWSPQTLSSWWERERTGGRAVNIWGSPRGWSYRIQQKWDMICISNFCQFHIYICRPLSNIQA